MKSKSRLDIVVVNWNSGGQLIRCLKSMAAPSFPPGCSVFVVDNSQNLDIGAGCPSGMPCEILRPSGNLGFGGGCNLGAKAGGAEFILFLNPDVEFFDGSFQELLAYLDSGRISADSGIIGLRLLNPDGTVQRNVARFPAYWQLFPRMLGLDRVLPRLFPPHFVRDMDYSSSQFVDQVPGGCFLTRRTVFKQLGGFEENFFMYYEDVDFSLRARQAGWKTFYLAEIPAIHHGGGTTARIKDRRLFYSMRSRSLYTARHFGRWKAVLLMAGILLLEFPVRVARSILTFSFSDTLQILKALGLFILNLPGTLKRIWKI